MLKIRNILRRSFILKSFINSEFRLSAQVAFQFIAAFIAFISSSKFLIYFSVFCFKSVLLFYETFFFSSLCVKLLMKYLSTIAILLIEIWWKHNKVFSLKSQKTQIFWAYFGKIVLFSHSIEFAVLNYWNPKKKYYIPKTSTYHLVPNQSDLIYFISHIGFVIMKYRFWTKPTKKYFL